MMQIDLFNQPENPTPQITGSDYDEKLDKKRLNTQYDKIFNLMKDGCYRTLQEISIALPFPEASISAQLRNMRKEGHTVLKQRRGEKSKGLFEYKLIKKEKPLN